jgi:integrase
MTPPSKPYPGFPLYAHRSGSWAAKVKGKTRYFGPWADPGAALKAYLRATEPEAPGPLPAPVAPSTTPVNEARTLQEVVDAFLAFKQTRVDGGELTQRSLDGYREVAVLLLKHFGKSRTVSSIRPPDFANLRVAFAKKNGIWRIKTYVQYTRSIFLFAYDQELIDRPVRYGKAFQGPSKRLFKLHRLEQGPKLFTAAEIHSLLNAATVPMRAMILLGINCGFGNHDCGTLPFTALDLEAGWVTHHRHKTGAERRCPLWPETVDALRQAIANRPVPHDGQHTTRVFVTKYGGSWAKLDKNNPVRWEFAKLLRRLGINRRKGLGFYTIRHTFRTVADRSKDQAACDLIMGHCRDDMASLYREGIDNDRLAAVAEHVRRWLFSLPNTP